MSRRHAERAAEEPEVAAVRARLVAALRAAPSPRPTRTFLIGSLAWGGFGVGSDVDLVVEGIDAAAASRLAAHLIRELPVMPQVLRLEELPPSFRERVLTEGVALDRDVAG